MHRKFRDEIVIQVRAGKGGPGAVSFLREKYRRIGPADGAAGGDGGNVVLTSTYGLVNLNHFYSNKIYAAQNGEPGSGKNRVGKKGRDLVIQVPLATVVEDPETGKEIFAFNKEGDSFLAAKGGIGGQGNSFFQSPTRRSPYFAQQGREGEFRTLRLKLKMIADIGLVGFPNAGKSTLLSKLTNAHPKIADYPFTTLSPNLGVLKLEDRTLILADIPGLIENAHKGAGLGLSFLKHIEKTKMILFVLDASDPQCPDSYRILQHELESYDGSLLKKKSIVLLNKTDLLSRPELSALKKKIKRNVVPISALTGEGLDEVLKTLEKAGI
jgi:GTP-binding protein